MKQEPTPRLTRREQQILDVLFRLGEASVNEIMVRLPKAPTSGAVRRMLNLLHAKGAVEYRHDGARKVYRPTRRKDVAGRHALKHVVETFFAGSAARTVAALFDSAGSKLSAEEKEQLARLIEDAKERGR